MRDKFGLMILAYVLPVSFIAYGDDWSYNDCIEWARQHNISLEQLRVAETVSDENLKGYEAEWQPSLEFSTTQEYSNAPWGNNKKNSYGSDYGLNASWTVWDGGKRENNIKLGKMQSSIARLDTEDYFRTLETEILSIYINILYAKESIEIYREAVVLSQAQADRARQLMESGRLSKVDYAQLYSQYEQDRYSLVDAESTYNTRRMELKRVLELGISDTISLVTPEWSDAQVLASLPDIEESYRLAVATDTKLKALQLGIESSDLEIAVAKAGRYPSVSLRAGVGTSYYAPGESFGTQMKQGFGETIGLTVSVPIFDKRQIKTAVAKANASRLDAELDVMSRYTDLAQNVESWYTDLKSAQARYVAGEEQVKAAELSNDLVNEQFNLGLVNTVELLTAHNTLLEARHSVLQAKYMAMLGHKMIEFYRTAEITM